VDGIKLGARKHDPRVPNYGPLLVILLIIAEYMHMPESTRLQLPYKYYASEYYPSSCLYLKTPPCLFFKTQRFGDRTLFPSSGKTYSVGPN
jgi:hypothetical protein